MSAPPRRLSRNAKLALWAILALAAGGAVDGQPADAPRPKRETKTVPDVAVTTHEGREVRFRDLIRGRIAVIDFIYTDCTFICAPQGRTFAGLTRLLGDRLDREVVLISVSLAPERDTPQALAQWAEKLGGAPPGWTLVTGSKRDINQIIRALAGYVSPQYHDGAAVIVHEPTNTWLWFNGTAAPATVLRKLESVRAATPE